MTVCIAVSTEAVCVGVTALWWLERIAGSCSKLLLLRVYRERKAM